MRQLVRRRLFKTMSSSTVHTLHRAPHHKVCLIDPPRPSDPVIGSYSWFSGTRVPEELRENQDCQDGEDWHHRWLSLVFCKNQDLSVLDRTIGLHLTTGNRRAEAASCGRHIIDQHIIELNCAEVRCPFPKLHSRQHTHG